jgi:FYVE zinc finger
LMFRIKWVATLQTNQQALDSNDTVAASKSLRAFSLPTEKRAVRLAQAWTPPRMLPFSENPQCHICEKTFALLRRKCHCRNCGVCVCRDCVVQWPSKMIPDTYNLKSEAYVNICKTCDWLCHQFRKALLEGDFDKVYAIHSTGNVNLNSPFGNVKGELFFPVHCAVLGGKLDLLKWLVDEHCCPVKSVRVSGKNINSSGTYTPIVTSKGRSLLGIAMEIGNIPIIRYLVVEKGISIAGERDITTAMLIQNLTSALYRLPPNATLDSSRSHLHMQAEYSLGEPASSGPLEEEGTPSNFTAVNGRSASAEVRESSGAAIFNHQSPDDSDVSDDKDECAFLSRKPLCV